MLDSQIFLAIAVASLVVVLIYVLMQRLSKPKGEPPRDPHGGKRHEPRPPPQRRP